jgi:hypothetical protein
LSTFGTHFDHTLSKQQSASTAGMTDFQLCVTVALPESARGGPHRESLRRPPYPSPPAMPLALAGRAGRIGAFSNSAMPHKGRGEISRPEGSCERLPGFEGGMTERFRKQGLQWQKCQGLYMAAERRTL